MSGSVVSIGWRFVYCEFCFFFKQRTAYEMRISDWSSNVCSSDLAEEDELVLGIIDDVGIVRHVDRFEDEAGFLVAVEAHEAFHAGRSELLGDECLSPFGEGTIDAAL